MCQFAANRLSTLDHHIGSCQNYPTGAQHVSIHSLVLDGGLRRL
ncbi:hypothetical protein I551_5071 [Mycobacterium ulcerans str. Harvey]|uniref:Uncharacterized protein n=1 Tax=Mycobacterium ulcerans str. Harvey TaxID=1299332 RepID=A0ABN0QUW8_MYCUL|nr:hypothetical protein I551_5071 [Mycobacterium ulcerans str. Harvey]